MPPTGSSGAPGSTDVSPPPRRYSEPWTSPARHRRPSTRQSTWQSPRRSATSGRGCTTRRSRAPTCGCRWRSPRSALERIGLGPGRAGADAAPSDGQRRRHGGARGTRARPRGGRRSAPGSPAAGRWAYRADPVVVHGPPTSRPTGGCCAARSSSGRAPGCGCCTPTGSVPPRPVEVPILIGALGPKGRAVAAELADGVFTVAAVPEFAREFSWVAIPVLGNGARRRRGPAVGEGPRGGRGRRPSTIYHGAYEYDANRGGAAGRRASGWP